MELCAQLKINSGQLLSVIFLRQISFWATAFVIINHWGMFQVPIKMAALSCPLRTKLWSANYE
jgi:hypothetical protein